MPQLNNFDASRTILDASTTGLYLNTTYDKWLPNTKFEFSKINLNKSSLPSS